MDPQELETTQTSAPVGAGVRHLDWPLSSKGCQAGTLVSLDEVNNVSCGFASTVQNLQNKTAGTVRARTVL